MFIVFAQAGADTWSYGPFENESDAVQLELRLADEYPNIEYETTELLSPSTA